MSQSGVEKIWEEIEYYTLAIVTVFLHCLTKNCMHLIRGFRFTSLYPTPIYVGKFKGEFFSSQGLVILGEFVVLWCCLRIHRKNYYELEEISALETLSST